MHFWSNSFDEGCIKWKLTCYYSRARSILIPGCEVIPVALFNALNGKDPSDYIARVEPSSKGGEKMAEYLLDIIDNGSSQHLPSPVSTQMMPVESSYIADRT